MVENRVSTSSMYRNNYNNIRGLQKEMYSLTKKISGNKYNNFNDITNKSDIKSIIDLNSDYLYANTYLDSAKMLVSKMEQMNFVLESIMNIAHSMQQEVILIKNTNFHNDINLIGIRAEKELHYIKSLLNTNASGDYLFSGSRINTPPVGDITIPNIDSGYDNEVDFLTGEINANYYYGDNLLKSALLGENITMNYGVNASDLGFQKVIAALHIIKESVDYSAGRGSDELLDRALQLVSSSVNLLEEQNTRLLGDKVNAERIMAYNAELKNYLIEKQEIIDENNGMNVMKMMVEFGEADNSLNAAMHTYSQGVKLTLLNHIK